MSLFRLNAAEQHELFRAIDQGRATQVWEAAFHDGDEDQYSISFWSHDGRIIRMEYNMRSGVTLTQEVMAEDRLRFKSHYGF